MAAASIRQVLGFRLTPGQAHDAPPGRELFTSLDIDNLQSPLIMDRASEGNEMRDGGLAGREGRPARVACYAPAMDDPARDDSAPDADARGRPTGADDRAGHRAGDRAADPPRLFTVSTSSWASTLLRE